jgi:DNA adenine methylase
MVVAKPFLRWAGGKNWFSQKVENYLPVVFNNYHEPFLGGGSIYFYLKARKIIRHQSYLSDLNLDLINAYCAIKENTAAVIHAMSDFKNEKDFYYNLRSKVFEDRYSKAAQFLFLNRTSFNGIYRVNQKGEYNVPYGDRKLAKLFDINNLVQIAGLLDDTLISGNDFMNTISMVSEGDLVFLDPPYTVAHENNGFVKYNQRIFAWEDQIRLQEYITELERRGAYYIMTNAAHVSIEGLYQYNGRSEKLKRPSLIGGRGAVRTVYNELVFTNINNG